MANEEHLALLLQGIELWNQWRKNNPQVKPDLVRAKLSYQILRGANLSRADLEGAHLSGANCVSANFSKANLIKAYLSEADCAGANFSRANLSNVSLVGAYLGAVDFTGATLEKTNFHGSSMSRTRLIDVDLSTVSGLTQILHKTRSSIGIDTIYRSKGKIPAEFLRGAGIPDNFIEYMRSLTGNAFEYYSCFISYSTQDQHFAELLFSDLQTNGVRCWFAPHHIQGGKKLHEQLDAAIRLHERLLLILSPKSINSEWVKTEIANARQREVREKKRVLFPVRIDISFDQLKDWSILTPILVRVQLGKSVSTTSPTSANGSRTISTGKSLLNCSEI